jgi:hypothetical protein
MSNGILVYSMADCVVAEWELLDMRASGKLNAQGVHELFTKVESAQA